jgi:hypothetical protein
LPCQAAGGGPHLPGQMKSLGTRPIVHEMTKIEITDLPAQADGLLKGFRDRDG